MKVPTLDEIEALEQTEGKQTFRTWIMVRHRNEKRADTWEESVEWLRQAFDPPAHPDVRLVSMERETLTNWS